MVTKGDQTIATWGIAEEQSYVDFENGTSYLLVKRVIPVKDNPATFLSMDAKILLKVSMTNADTSEVFREVSDIATITFDVENPQ